MNLRKLSLVAAMFAVAGGACADVVTRVMVRDTANKVVIYHVDSAGAWTSTSESFIAFGTGKETLYPYRYKVDNGYFYVLDSMGYNEKSANPKSRINKYTLKGEFVETVVTLSDYFADDFCFTADGGTIYFTSAFAKVNAGKIMKYDIAAKSTNLIDGSSCTRQINRGFDNKLYIGSRGSTSVLEIDPATDTVTSFGSGVVGTPNAVCYDDVAKKLYTADTSGKVYEVGSDKTVTQIACCATSEGKSPQASHLSMIDGKLYLASLQSNYKAPINLISQDAESKWTTNLVAEQSGSANLSCMEPIPLAGASVRWAFDEAANSVTMTSADGARTLDATDRCFLQSGADGVDQKALYFNAKSYGEFLDSTALLPATDDFTLTLWAGLPEADTFTAPRTILSNGELTLAVGTVESPNALTLTWGESSAASTTAFADGGWHHLALTREGTAVKAYVDGTLAVTLTLAEATALAQTSNWFLGATTAGENTLGAGAFVDELRIYNVAYAGSAITTFATEFEVPSAPKQPAMSYTALPADYGTELAHNFVIDAKMGDSMLFKRSNGELWIAQGRGGKDATRNCNTSFRKSTDSGANWSTNAAPELAGSSISLFEADGNLCAMGFKVSTTTARSQAAVWKLVEGEWVEQTTVDCDPTQDWRLSSGSVGYIQSTKTFVKAARAKYTATGFGMPAQISFKYDGGVFSNGATNLPYASNRSVVKAIAAAHCVTADVEPGDMVQMSADIAYGFWGMVDQRISDARFRTGDERMIYSPSTKDRLYFVDDAYSPVQFPGGAKAFAIRYDATSSLYWAVTVGATTAAEQAGKESYAICSKLTLYSSTDQRQWHPRGVIINGNDAAIFRAPSFEIIGDDLVVVYSVGYADNAGYSVNTTAFNYLATTKVAGFRSRAEEKPGSKYLLVANASAMIKRYWQTEGGLWLEGPDFATGKYDGDQLGSLMGVARLGDRVYIGGEGTKGKLFEFTRKGQFIRKFYCSNWKSMRIDAIRPAKNGTDLLVTDAFDTKTVYRVTPSSNTWTPIINDTLCGSHLGGRVRGVVEHSDGRIFVGADKGLFEYTPDGEGGYVYSRQLSSMGACDAGLYLDEANNRLFFGLQSGSVVKYDFSTGIETYLQTRSNDTNSAIDVQLHDGLIYVSDYHYPGVYVLNPEAVNDERAIISSTCNASRMWFIDESETNNGLILTLE